MSRKDLPPPNSPGFGDKVREAISTYFGYRGDKLDRGITVRDLQDSGLAKISGNYLAGGNSPPISGPGSAIGSQTPDYTPPPQPTGFSASAAISNVLVSTDSPKFTQGHGYAKTRLYGAHKLGDGSLPTFSNAVTLTEFTGAFGAYPTDPATTWYLWATWWSVDGVESTPAGGTNGVAVTTGQDVSTLLTALSGQITRSQLYSALGSKIDSIDVLSAQVASLSGASGEQFDAAAIWYFDTGSDGWRDQTAGAPSAVNAGWLVPPNSTTNTSYNTSPTGLNIDSGAYKQARARVRKIGSPTWYGAVGVSGDAGAAVIVAEPTWDADGIANVAWDMSSHTMWTGSVNAIYFMLQLNASTANHYEIDWIAVGRPAPGASTAALASEVSARTSADSALTTQVTALQASVNGNSAAIATEATARANADGSLQAQYTVKVDVAGLISGFGLASTANNAAPTSAFGVRANQFYVAPPSVAQSTAPTTNLYRGFVWLDTSVTPNITRYYDGASWTTAPQAFPFAIQTAPTTVNGVAGPAGVYMDGAFIQNGTITNAKIGNAEIDDAKIADLSASKITTGVIDVGQQISSSNYIAGSQGWTILGNGTAEMNNMVLRGTIYATAGLIGGNSIDASGVQSPGYTPGSTGWRLDSNGMIRAFSGAGNFVLDPTASGSNPALKVTDNFYVRGDGYLHLRGTISGGGFTDAYAWPPVGQGGFLLSNTGLLIGNVNGGPGIDGYVEIDYTGRLYMPGLSVAGGVLTISQANVINTLNIAGEAVTVPRAAQASGALGLTYNGAVTLAAPPALDAQGSSVLVTMDAIYTPTDSPNYRLPIFHLYRNGALIFQWSDSQDLVGNQPSYNAQRWLQTHQVFIDTPPAGATSYVLIASNGYAPNCCTFYQRSMSLLGCKR